MMVLHLELREEFRVISIGGELGDGGFVGVMLFGDKILYQEVLGDIHRNSL